MPYGGTYAGLDEIFGNYFANVLSNFEGFHAIPETYLDAKDHTAVIGKYVRHIKEKERFWCSFFTRLRN